MGKRQHFKLHQTTLLTLFFVVTIIVAVSPAVVPPVHATPDFFSSSSDGNIFATSGAPKPSYMVAQSASSGYVSDSLDFMRIGQDYDSMLLKYSISRGFVFFDTSALDDDLEITSAVLGLYGHTDGSDSEFNIVVQNGQPTYPHDPLETTDYNKNNYDGNGGEFDIDNHPYSFSTTKYNYINLNADGISWINKEGWTKFCLRSSEDIAASAPTGSEQVWVWSSESDHPPLLEVGWYVEESSDDCFYSLHPVWWTTTYNHMYAGDATSSEYDSQGGMRWKNITIPQAATISSAFLKMWARGIYGSIPTTLIQGEDIDNAITFSTASDYEERIRTSASVLWTPSDWTISTWHTSSDIKSIVQEIIDRVGWVSGNAIVLFWGDSEEGWGGVSSRLQTASADLLPEWSPRLEITWTIEEDSTPPTYSNVGTNTTVAGTPCLFHTKWTDERGLATTGGYIFGTNNTGTWTNDTWASFSSNPDWANVTKTLNSTVCLVIGYIFYANDTSNNWNNTGIHTITTTSEEEEVIDCNWIGVNNTIAGEATRFFADWTDLNASKELSHNLFSTNNTGSWVNGTWTDVWFNQNWTEAAGILNGTGGLSIAFRFYVNDTSGVEYASTICCFVSSPPVAEADTIRSVFLLFIPCILFSLLYEFRNNPSVRESLDLRWAGVVASGCWIILGIAWFVLAATTFVVGLLWNGIEILYIVRVMVSLVRMQSLGRRLGDDAF